MIILAENLQQINPIVTVITELISTGVMGVVAAMAWIAYRDERNRSKELVNSMAEIGIKQIESQLKMANALTQNNIILEKTKETLTTNTMVLQTLSDRISIVLLPAKIKGD